MHPLRKAGPFVRYCSDVKSSVLVTLLLGVSAALAQQPDQNPAVRHLIGLESIKRNATGQLTVQNGAMQFKGAKNEAQISVAVIDDVFIGSETTQGGGKTARVMKTAAIAAPYGSGHVLSLLLRTKVDILTVSYHETGGGLRGAIFALPKGEADKVRDKLVQAGAHTNPAPEPKQAGKP
jgi:hypothetical protein